MKKLLTLFIVILLAALPTMIFAQNFVDEEVDDLAEKIATKLDAKNTVAKKRNRIKTIVVEDFRDTEGKVSKLGASLAEEFSLAISSAGVTFSVTANQDLASPNSAKKKFDFNKMLDGARKLMDGATDDHDYEKNRKRNDALKSIDGAGDITESFKIDKGRYKGIDAVVTGTLTESSDQYRLLIKVISTDENFKMITNVRGYLTKTPFIRQLEEEENQRRQVIDNGNEEYISRGGLSYGDNYGGSAQLKVESNYTKIELLEARQVGQKIECDLRITNIGSDIEFYIYGYNSGGKGIDSNNSYDYHINQVTLGEIIDNRNVHKTLVTNNPVTAKVTLTSVARPVDKLAKLAIKCYGHGGTFWVEFRDVQVNR